MGYLDTNGLTRFYNGLKSKFIRSVNGYIPDANGNVTLPNIESSTENRQTFSYTVDPSEWLSGVNGEYWTDYVDAVQIGVSSLSLVNLVVVSDVLNEDTGLNPQNGYAFGMQCQRQSTDLSNPYPNRVRFYYGKGDSRAPGNPLTFTGYVVADDGATGGTNVGYYVNGADSGHPVGSIYQSLYNVSPALLFGGTWERINGRFLLGATDGGSVGTTLQKTASVEAGSSGGEAAHLLSTSEIPAHSHQEHGYWSTGSGSESAYMNTANRSRERKRTDNNTGGGGTHNNMPPFLAVYTWKRVG